MSTHDTSQGPDGHGTQTEDRIDFSKVIAVGVVSLVIFALASWWAISFLHGEQAELKNRSEGRITSNMGKPEIGIVDQVPFQGDDRLEIWKKERAEWLAGYGWIDRAHGIIHIPIEQAMDQLLAGSAPTAVPNPAAAPAPAVGAPQ